MTKSVRAATLFVIVAPLLAVAMIPFVFASLAVKEGMLQLLVWYLITGLGITISFHRELTHLSLKHVPPLRYSWFLAALFSLEGGIDWVADHRKHHKHTDRKGDPHSPYEFGEDWRSMLKGFRHAHYEWLLRKSPSDRMKWTPDLLKEKWIVRLDRLFPLWAVLTFILPGFTALALYGDFDWRVFASGVFWGGPVRIFVVHHITWSINSWCHMFGKRPFRGSTSDDRSTNSWFFGVVGFGEGWHRNHHAFPTSSRIGLYWWQLDPGWIVIWTENMLGLVESLKTPTIEEIKRKRIRTS